LRFVLFVGLIVLVGQEVEEVVEAFEISIDLLAVPCYLLLFGLFLLLVRSHDHRRRELMQNHMWTYDIDLLINSLNQPLG
jgi:hypothetical protein